MARFAVDSNCIIAAVSDWHVHHNAVVGEISARLEREETLVVPAHALAEAYAVLTRLPAPYRLSTTDAWTALSANFIKPARIAALTARRYATLLRRAAQDGTAGGRTYDAIIGESARLGKAETLLTLNPHHFDPSPAGIAIVDPSAA